MPCSLSNPVLYPEQPISPPFPWTECHITEILSVPKKPRCCTDGQQQIWDISFSDSSGLSFVLLDSAVPCFPMFHWMTFIANFPFLLAMNEHFCLLVQIQSFSTLRHPLRSAAVWSAAYPQLRPDAGEMLCMGATNGNPVFVAVCQNSPSFCCYGVSSAQDNFCAFP